MKRIKRLIAILFCSVFLFGLGIFLYPVIRGSFVDYRIQQKAKEFLGWIETSPDSAESTESQVVIEAPSEATGHDIYSDLWKDMTAYNDGLALGGQASLNGQFAFEKEIFRLAEYGLEDEIFGVITIPKLEIEMPIFLGATEEHMADGAALLGHTSIPIGGIGTNAVIAGHRGYQGAHYFRFIDELVPGDIIRIRNLWDTLTYTVTETMIIEPHEVQHILIRPEKELLTLLTCHPYASGGRQRYLVICERAAEPYQEIAPQ